MKTANYKISLLLLFCSAFSAVSNAAVLTYPLGYSQDGDRTGYAAGDSGASVTAYYGDNISQADIDAGYYGSAYGPTPNVTVNNDYADAKVYVRNDGFGDLDTVLSSSYSWYMIDLIGTDNHVVNLKSFEMATMAGQGREIYLLLRVDDQIVKRYQNFYVGDDGHVTFNDTDADGTDDIWSFGEIKGRKIGIQILSNRYGAEVEYDTFGVTNIAFEEIEDFTAFDPVPDNDSANITLATDLLSWSSHDNVEYDVYVGIGEDLSGVAAVRTTEPNVLLSDTALPYNGELDPNTVYSWRVDTIQIISDGDDIVTAGPVWNFKTVSGKADTPNPSDGEIDLPAKGLTLGWNGTAGGETVNAEYVVYFGEPNTLTLITDAQGQTELSAALQKDLQASRTYQWRVDTLIHGNTITGDLWQFTTASAEASNPAPPTDGTGFMSSVLNWSAGSTALSHNVYFSEDAEITEADFQGNQLETVFTPMIELVADQTYYWRVDEVVSENPTDPVVTGPVWQFTVSPLPTDGLIVAMNPETVITNANDGYVEKWMDISGKNNHAVKMSPDSRPSITAGAMNGHDVLRFDGDDDYLQISANPVNFDVSGLTWFVVGKVDTDQTSTFLSSGYQYGCNGWKHKLWGTQWLADPTGSVWHSWLKVFGWYTSTTTASLGGLAEPAVIGSAWDGNTTYLYVNGFATSGFGYEDEEPTTLSGHKYTRIGASSASYTTPSDLLDGDIAEILVYDRFLTAEEKGAIDHYLYEKYVADFDRAKNPSPADKYKRVNLDTLLSWQGPANATYNVEFKEGADDDWQTIATGISETLLDLAALDEPIELDYEAQYMWRVRTIKSNGQQIKGNDWSFETWVPYCTESLAGDIDGDCKVNMDDLVILMNNWLNVNNS